ncbi:MAG: oxygen-independent coproporphyrinogen III oxidase [Paludibacter sp.]|nr:oxygen-independent coproporphyrinogen III oxidase [Paludibacter sp.]
MEISHQLIQKYNIAVPRYTSYPPANHFQDVFPATEALSLIDESNSCTPDNIALYIHIPFCKKICFYCGCNTTLMKQEETIARYIESVKQEIRMVASRLDRKRKVTQVHYGGGTPNSISAHYLEEINQLIFDLFDFIPRPEIAIECHPAHLDELYLQRLLNARFNRFSIGVQDFNDEVLDTVNRSRAAMPVEEIVRFLKEANPTISVNLDFIYGLPGQTVENFNQTIAKAIRIRPDRLVTFSYAHVPWLKKHQQILEKRGLPGSQEKIDLFMSSRRLLLDAGYVPIGLDHYVLPTDELNLALANQQLHRNFQGYCTRRTTGQVYAFGVSSISQLETGYFQNVKDISAYMESIGNGQLPVEKGMRVTVDQQLIRAVIEDVMCNKRIDITAFCARQGITYEQFVAVTGFNPAALTEMSTDGLIGYQDKILEITDTGSFFIRNIACVFDPAYQTQAGKYSQSV